MNLDNQNLTSTLTPLMRQYWDVKSLHPDKIVLFRMGDFFEMFFDDAKTAAPILGIALTQRNKKSQDETPMCGMPHHSIGTPINKLLKAGHKVAICDQIEDPKTAKGIVKRAVTRILTPGMVYDSDTLEQTKSLFLAAMLSDEKKAAGFSVAFAETTTGEFFYFEDLNHAEALRLLQILPVAELVVKKSDAMLNQLTHLKNTGVMLTETEIAAPIVSEMLLQYIQGLSQNPNALVFNHIEKRSLKGKLELSETALKHLEVFETSRGEYQGSLCWAIDRTKTSAGARLLKEWLSFPLTDRKHIFARQNQIATWIADIGRLKNIREILSSQGDLERRLGRIGTPQACARDLLSLGGYIENALRVVGFANQMSPVEIDFSKLDALKNILQNTFVEEAPISVKQGGMIQKGVSAELDEWIDLATNSQALIQKLEDQEKQKTGISSLKIRYNNVFGYYIEITHVHKDKVPASYMRKQTLANAERYTTDELTEIEKKVLMAQTRRNELEFEIYENTRVKTLSFAAEISKLAHIVSELDVITSFAWLAIEKKYVRPELLETQEVNLESSRHPVIEQSLKATFTANDIQMHSGDCLLLTGPNMAGKSTLMRQVGLISVLAQVGSYVPAARASVGVFDKIFTRIGASDSLSEGLSTFMVEMKESAEILKSATANSLVILDEIGRGTSTYDGMSLAQAILEYLLTEKKSVIFFATHYHELTVLEKNYPQLKNAHMSVVERGGEIHFLHTLKQGPAGKSYGIHVGKLAGLPASVTERAKTILDKLETVENSPGVSKAVQKKPVNQLSLFEAPPEVLIQDNPKHLDILSRITQIDIGNITPVQALMELERIQQLSR